MVLEVDHSTDARLAGAGVLIMDCDTGVELLEQFAAEVEIALNREDQAFYRSPSVNAVSRDRQVDTWPR